jgi:hypothetical protein
MKTANLKAFVAFTSYFADSTEINFLGTLAPPEFALIAPVKLQAIPSPARKL